MAACGPPNWLKSDVTSNSNSTGADEAEIELNNEIKLKTHLGVQFGFR